MSKRGHLHKEASSGSVLDALLLAEHEAAERLSRARTDAATLIATATAEADALTTRARAALEAELAAADATHVAAMREMEREVAESAAHTVTRYRTITEEMVTRLATIVLTEVAGLSTPSTAAIP